MRLVVVTSPEPLRREVELIGELLELGVSRVHLRWPTCSHSELSAHILRIAERHRRKLVLHQHHELAQALGVGGCHWRDGTPHPSGQTPAFRSRACHTAEALLDACGVYDSLLVAPVFPSISKPAHRPVVSDWRLGELRQLRDRLPAARPSRACALGGVTPSTIPECHALGFDEVAVLGCVWGSGEPLRNVSILLAALADLEAPHPVPRSS